MRWNGRASAPKAARGRAPGCAPRPTRSRAAPARSCSASWPNGFLICRGLKKTPHPEERPLGRVSKDEAFLMVRDGARAPPHHEGPLGINRRPTHRNRSMALVLNEEQSMLRDSARGLISDKAPVAHLPQLDAVAVPWHSRACGFRLVARRQRRAEIRISGKDRGWLAAGRACHRRRRQASPAANQNGGGALRQRL